MTGKQLYLIGYISCMAQAMRFNLFEGEWHDGNVPIMGPRTHAAWLGSTVFDGPAPSRALRPISIGIAQGSIAPRPISD
jgi:hypothetical protein